MIRSCNRKEKNAPSSKGSQVNVGSREVRMLGFRTWLNEDFKGKETNMSLVNGGGLK